MVRVVEQRTKEKKQLLPQEYEEKLKKMKKEHEKLVKGRFEFSDANGGFLEFSHRIFPGYPIQTITINHGEICELPMGIVKQINNCVHKVRKYDMTQIPNDGPMIGRMPRAYSIDSRCKFVPVDFI